MSMICELFIIPARTARELIADPTGVHKLLESLEGSDQVLSLEKSWHGLHFVLTETAWEGRPPLDFLASGGVPVGDEDVGYGPARILDPEGVTALDEALTEIEQSDFHRNFDPIALSDAAIYPQIWDEPVEDQARIRWLPARNEGPRSSRLEIRTGTAGGNPVDAAPRRLCVAKRRS